MADEIVEKRGRGRPKGTGGNKRPDSTAQLQPGDNRKYLTHDLRMWDWPDVNMKEPEQVKARIGQYFQICAEDDMKPSVAGMALAFGVDRKTLWCWCNGVDSAYIPTESRTTLKKRIIFERTDGKLYAEWKDQPRCRYLPDEEQHGLCGQAGGRVDTQPAARRSGSCRRFGEEVPRRCSECVRRL